MILKLVLVLLSLYKLELGVLLDCHACQLGIGFPFKIITDSLFELHRLIGIYKNIGIAM